MADSAASERRRRPEPAGRRTLRDEQRALTRRRLADAARELFEQDGYAAVTADAIARHAGANRATFYLHYASKAEVVLELMDAMDDQIMATIAPVGELDDPSAADVRRWLTDVVGFFEANRALVEAHHQAMPVEPQVAQRWWKGYERMSEVLSGLWSDERTRLRVVIALVAIERMFWYDVVAHVPVDRGTLLDAMTEEWLELLRAAPARA